MSAESPDPPEPPLLASQLKIKSFFYLNSVGLRNETLKNLRGSFGIRIIERGEKP